MPTVRHHLKRCTKWLKTNRVYTIGTLAVVFAFLAAFPAHADGFEETIASSVATIFHILTFFLAFIINAIGYAVGKLLVLVLGMVIIPILGYNGFADSNLIDIGWPLVRDVVNMFVIVILLVIAIRTIIGYGDKGWEQQLPRLFIAVIAVNFSRTITLLIVDMGQVVMFTFVNALRDIAAGNFTNMFQLTDFFALNTENIEASNDFEAGASALNDLGYLATSYATLIFLIAVFAVMVLLAIVFIYRIVIIWVLTIMSPAAFFLSGIKSVVPKAGGPAEEWWKKLIGAVALGPILTFFLWLALASAAEGSIASSEGFPTEGTEDVPTLLSEALGIEQLLSLFLAMVIIMAGFQAASSSASSLGGFAGSMINEKTGKTLVKNAATMPATLGYRAGKAGVKFGGRQVLARTGIGETIGRNIQRVGGDLEKSGVIGGRAAGRLVRGLGGRVETESAAVVDKAREVGMERAQSKGRRERINDMMGVGDPGDAFMLSDRYEQEANFQDLLTDKKMRSELKDVTEETAKREADSRADQFENDEEREAWIEQRQRELYDEKMGHALTWADSDYGKALLADKKAEVNKAKAGNLRAMGSAEEIGDFIGEMGDDFKLSMLSEEDMQNEEVLQALAGHTMREYYDKDNNLIRESALQQAAMGKGGVDAKVKRAARGEGAEFDDLVQYAGWATDDDGNPVLDSAGNRVRERVESSTAIGQAIQNDQLKLHELTVDHLSTEDASGASVLDENKIAAMAKALVSSGADLGGLAELQGSDPAAYGALMTALQDGSRAAATTEERRKWDKAYLSADTSGASSTGFVDGAGGFHSDDAKKSVREMVVEQPTQVFKFEANLSATAGSTDLTKLIESKVSKTTARNMKDLFAQAEDSGDTHMQERIRQSAATIAEALQREVTAAGADVTREMENKLRTFQSLSRYTTP